MGVSMGDIFAVYISICLHDAILSLIATWFIIWFGSSVSLCDLWLLVKPFSQCGWADSSLFSWHCTRVISECDSHLSPHLALSLLAWYRSPAQRITRVVKLQGHPYSPGSHQPRAWTQSQGVTFPNTLESSFAEFSSFQVKMLARPFQTLLLAFRKPVPT